jgi:hypothetical protein
MVAGGIFLTVSSVSFLFLWKPTSEPLARPHAQPALNPPRDRDDPVASSKPTPPARDGLGQADVQRERLLESVGSVSSIYLYQTYLNIGLLADAVRSDTYAKKDAGEVLSTLLTLLRTVDAQMQKLENAGLDEDELSAVNQVRKISRLLQNQADHLQRHWKTGEASSLTEYQQVRRHSWIELRLILGLAAENADKTN